MKSDHSVSQVRKNISQWKNKEATRHKADNGDITEAAVNKCEENTDGTSPVPTQGLNSSQSFTIIDVAANRLLFDTFIAEWRQQWTFSFSVACEKRPKQQVQHSWQSTEGIGAKFTRGNQNSVKAPSAHLKFSCLLYNMLLVLFWTQKLP